jgi:hypothetical protein
VPPAKKDVNWKNEANRKAFFDQLAIKWNIQKPEDWNTVTIQMVLKEGGQFIKKYYNSSLRQGTYIYSMRHTKVLISITSTLP